MIDPSCTSSAKMLALPQITLCAVTSVNVTASLRALEACLEQIEFGSCKLFTDALVQAPHAAIEIIPIDRLNSSAAYSEFLLNQLVDRVRTSHCLIVQWDGHVIDARHWHQDFLGYDYIGASWPQFSDGHDVGNGGFSLRSKRLMEACRSPDFVTHHPEDVAIGRANRSWLEERGMRFAPREVADVFSTERAGSIGSSFGYHGVWNMPDAIGIEKFWEIYEELDERSTIWTDHFRLMMHMSRGDRHIHRWVRMLVDRIRDAAMKPIRRYRSTG